MDPSAQDVVDAIRFALMAQDDPQEALKLVKLLLDLAPETMSDGGFDLISLLLAEASLKLSVIYEAL